MVGIGGGAVRRVLPFRLDVGVTFNWAWDGRHLIVTEYSEFPAGHEPNLVRISPYGTHPVQLTHVTRSGLGCGANAPT